MTWMKAHPRATLLIVAGLQTALVLLGSVVLSLSWEMMMVITFVPYIGMALVNAWVLKLKGRSRHWLWFYLLYSWGGPLIPVGVALLSKQPVNDQVPSLSA